MISEWPVDHRPWPVPDEPWIMFQQWNDLLFAHWRVPEELLRPLVPPVLPLDAFHGENYIGITPFHMSGVRPRFMPPVPGLSDFPELNVRTYVTLDGKPGIWFFSLEAGNRLAVETARSLFHLPYFQADMNIRQDGPWIRYRSARTRRDAPPAAIELAYRPTGQAFQAEAGTREHFLTERYCLYTVEGTRLYRCEIHHPPWPLQPAEAEIHANTMLAPFDITLPLKPDLLHFSKVQPTVIFPIHEIPAPIS